jgi:hypothetical protein
MGEPAIVTRVIDGDTIEVDLDGEIVDVRLIGIDTPETVDLGGTFDYVDVSAGQGWYGAGAHYAWSTTHGHTTWQTIGSWSPGFRSNWLVAGYRGKSYTWTP